MPDAAPRTALHRVVGALAPQLPELLGGAAEQTAEGPAALEKPTVFQKATPEGSYLGSARANARWAAS